MRIIATHVVAFLVVGSVALQVRAAEERPKGTPPAAADKGAAKEAAAPAAADKAAKDAAADKAAKDAAPADPTVAQYTSELEAAGAEYAKASAAIRAESDEKFAAINATYEDVTRRSRDAYLKALEAQREQATKAGNKAEVDAIGQKIDYTINGPPRTEIQKLWTASYAAEAAADFDGALEAIEKVMAATGNTQNAFTQVRIGWLHYLSGNFDKSEAAYKSAAALAPRSVTPLHGLLNCRIARKQTDEAVEAARAMLKLDPLNIHANKTLGELYYGKEDYTRAGAYYQRLVTNYCDDLQSAANLGWCYLKLDHKPLAKQIFFDVLAVQPDNLTANNGLIALAQEKTDSADATPTASPAIEKIVIRNPKEMNRAIKYTLNGQYPATLEPGSEQTLEADRPWTIRFDQAGPGSQVQQRLEAGRYEFGAEGKRVKLARRQG